MKSFFQDNLKVKFSFLIIQTLLCNALLLLAVSHLLTFMIFNHFNQDAYSQGTTYAVISLVLLIFSICFIFLNKQFYEKYQFYKVTIAEKVLARNGILTAQFIRPANIKVETKVELGSLSYHQSIKEINSCIDVAIRNGRILLGENNNLDTKFYIYGREETNVKIAQFRMENINELKHEKNKESTEPVAS